MTHTLTYRIHEVAPYINWIYFFHAWGFPPRFAAISRIHGCDACRAGWLAEFPEEERARAAEAMQLFKDANRMLAQLDGDFHTHVRFGLYPACSDGDDLLLTDPEQEGAHASPRLAAPTTHHETGRALSLPFGFRTSAVARHIRHRRCFRGYGRCGHGTSLRNRRIRR